MELHACEIFLLDDRGERHTVIADGGDFVAVSGSGVRVREIKVGVFGNAHEQLAGLAALHLIPPDVRGFHVLRQHAHFPAEKAEAGIAGSFFAQFVHGLQAEANAEDGNAGIVRHAQRRGEIALVQSGDECGEVSYAGKNNGLGVDDLLGTDGALGFRAELLQGALDRGQIAGAVIDDGDFHDGSLSREELSDEMETSANAAHEERSLDSLNNLRPSPGRENARFGMTT